MSSMDVDVSGGSWRKSLRSVGNGACVEVASASESIMVRDSVDRAGLVIRYSAQTWDAFLAEAKTGTFDVLRQR
jgi:hypothetical protein